MTDAKTTFSKYEIIGSKKQKKNNKSKSYGGNEQKIVHVSTEQ